MTVFLVGTGTNAPGIGALSFANSQSQSSGTIFFGNGGNVSFGLTNGVVTASAAGGGGSNGIALSASNASYSNLSQIVFSNQSNVSFGLATYTSASNAGYITANVGGAIYNTVVVDPSPAAAVHNYGPGGWGPHVNLIKVEANGATGTTIYSMNMTGFQLATSFIIRNFNSTGNIYCPLNGDTSVGATYVPFVAYSDASGGGAVIPPNSAKLVYYDADGLVFL